MTRSTPKLSPQILEEATDWFVEFSEGTVDAAARARFDAWLRRSPEHVQAYLNVAALWEDASLLAKGRTGDAHELIARVLAHDNVVPLVPRAAPESPVVPIVEVSPNTRPTKDVLTIASSPPRSARRWVPIAVAASTLVAVVTGGWFYSQRGTYSTGTGEQRSVRLEDGSLMELNSRSRVRVRYAEHERIVEMLEGQAFFQVAKDAARPFLVRSDSTNVLAIGTQFDVYRRDSGTTVTVVDGRVAVFSSTLERAPEPPQSAVAPGARSGAARVDDIEQSVVGRQLLQAGEQITIAPQHAPTQPHRADATAATAWTQHKIILHGTPLSEVAVEFNRYNTRQLVITDPSLANTQITGVFSSTDPDSLLRFLRSLPDVDVQEGPAEVRVGRR
jgi:transmembrane sensor